MEATEKRLRSSLAAVQANSSLVHTFSVLQTLLTEL